MNGRSRQTFDLRQGGHVKYLSSEWGGGTRYIFKANWERSPASAPDLKLYDVLFLISLNFQLPTSKWILCQEMEARLCSVCPY